jgi:hypothetical protein
VVADNNPPDPEAHVVGQVDGWTLLAVELAEPHNMVVCSGESPYDHYNGIYKPELRQPDRYGPDDYYTQGNILARNIIYYALSEWHHPVPVGGSYTLVNKHTMIIPILLYGLAAFTLTVIMIRKARPTTSLNSR